MRKIKFFTLVFVLTLGSQCVMAQDSTYLSNEYAKALALFDKSQKYNDAVITKQALYEILILNPNDSSALRSLAELYYNNSQFTSSALVGLDFLQRYPSNMIALEVIALSYENLRLNDKAIEYYEKLWLQSDNSNTLYQIAYLQYSLKRYDESIANLGILDTKLKDEDKIALSKSDGSAQEVSFKAAVFNLKGLIAVEQGKNEEAKTNFSNALKLNPDFEIAKKSLDALNKG